jgi:hypothetical protein
MRSIISSFVLAAAVLAAACAPSDKPTSPLTPGTSVRQGGVPDTAQLPDLIVDSKGDAEQLDQSRRRSSGGFLQRHRGRRHAGRAHVAAIHRDDAEYRKG